MISITKQVEVSTPTKRTALMGRTLAEWVAFTLVVFLVLFPKGGIKVGPIPLTWGYFLLGAVCVVGMPWWIMRRPLGVRGTAALALALVLPLQAVIIYSLVVNGVGAAGFAISTCVSLFFLPVFFLVYAPSFLRSSIRMDKLLSILKACLFLAAVYGIFLFFWRIATGHFIEIPYLTVNAADYGLLATTKHIDRDGLFKLISTYNNGNLYGVATLILLPLYDLIEPRRWRKLLIRLALVLTLSRTVWIGLVLLQVAYLLGNLTQRFRRVRLIQVGKSKSALLILAILVIAVVAGVVAMSRALGVITGASFGGRSQQFEYFVNATILPSVPVGAFLEIVYPSAAKLFGYAGLFSFVVFITSPIVLYCSYSRLRQSAISYAAFLGLVIYLFLCAMDGGFDYIPVLAFYWFAYMIFLYGDVQVHPAPEPLIEVGR